MAYGDVGGAVTELVITCKTPSRKGVNIKAGDAVCLIDTYTVDNVLMVGGRVFGQALDDCDRPDAAIPVKVRGVSVFSWSGYMPHVGGGITSSCQIGEVRGGGQGIVLKVQENPNLVHVLL